MVRFIRYIILIALLQAVAGIFSYHTLRVLPRHPVLSKILLPVNRSHSYPSILTGQLYGAMTDDNGTFTLQNNQGYTKLRRRLDWDTILNSSISSPVKRMTIWKYC